MKKSEEKLYKGNYMKLYKIKDLNIKNSVLNIKKNTKPSIFLPWTYKNIDHNDISIFRMTKLNLNNKKDDFLYKVLYKINNRNKVIFQKCRSVNSSKNKITYDMKSQTNDKFNKINFSTITTRKDKTNLHTLSRTLRCT